MPPKICLISITKSAGKALTFLLHVGPKFCICKWTESNLKNQLTLQNSCLQFSPTACCRHCLALSYKGLLVNNSQTFSDLEFFK